MMYRQVVLQSGCSRQVCWIQEDLAKVGKSLRIDGYQGMWQVASVGDNRKSEEYILAHERDHIYHRDRTDI